MKKNMGAADRTVRIAIAAVIALLVFSKLIGGTWGIILLVLTVVLLLTSIFGNCPLYSIFGFNTFKKKPDQ
jgi:Protein of unknown function (DUF2892)